MIFKLILLEVLFICEAKRYDDYTLFRVVPTEDSHLEFLQKMTTAYDVNYWKMPGSLRMPVDFVVGPKDKESLLKDANKIGVKMTMIMENIQSALDNQTVKPYTRSQIDSFGWKNYYRIKDIYYWLNDLAKTFPKEVEFTSIGKTHKNIDIMAVKVVLNGSLRRSKVIVEGGIHAREWISPAFVTYMLYQILNSSKSSDKALRTVALTYEWYFVPVLNPDGYEYTFTTDRLWRKNRNGLGIDLNRNFDYEFGSKSSSFDKRSQVYCGESPFSEKETAAMSKFVISHAVNLEYYISFHSYGQYIIVPHPSQNFPNVKKMGMETAKKIQSYYKTQYAVGTYFQTVGYNCSGDSPDWVKYTFDIPYAVTAELRDTGVFGFALPTQQILPTCIETLGGLLVFLTPRSRFQKNMRDHRHDDTDRHMAGQTQTYLDETVIISYVLCFTSILRFY